MSLFGKVIGGVVGFVIGGPVGAVAGVAAAGTKPVDKAADFTIHTLSNGVKVIEKAGVIIVDAIEDVASALYNVLRGTIAFRRLRPSEMAIARVVFGPLLPLDRIVISSLSGAMGRPFTIPGSMLLSVTPELVPGFGPLLDLVWFLEGMHNKYIMFLGEDGYNHPFRWDRDQKNKSYLPAGAAVMKRDGATLIHEMTHVWESHYGTLAWGYVFGSLWNQCACIPGGGSAYTVTPGAQWSKYNPEQQARLVESWYIMNYDSYRLYGQIDPVSQTYEDYMKCNIRTGNPHATTVFTNLTRLRAGGVHLDTSLLRTSGIKHAPASAGIADLHVSRFKWPPTK